MTAPELGAIIVTRGDVPLDEALGTLRAAGVAETVVWDNSRQLEDLGPYGKYEAIRFARADVILVQDDDVVLPIDSINALAAAYEPGKLTVNMPERFRAHYPDSAMVGFGAVFERALPQKAFSRLFDFHAMSRYDPLFLRESCRAFTVLTPLVLVDVPYVEQPWANDPNRLWRQPEHVARRDRMLELARQVRDQ